MPKLSFDLSLFTRNWRDVVRFASILRRFRSHLRPQLWPLVMATLASLGFTVVTLMEPWPLQVIFDGVLLREPVSLFGIDLIALSGGRPLFLLAGASLAVLVLAALRGQLYYLQNVIAATSGQDVVMGIRRDLFAHLQALSLSFHRRARSGDLLMRMTGDIVMLREMVVAALITLVTQGLVLVGIIAIMATLNLRLTLVALLAMPVLFVILSTFRVKLVDAAQRQRKREGRLASTVHEILGNVLDVQAYTAERHENERFKEMNKRSLRAGVRLTRIEGQLNRSVQITMAVGICLTLWFGSLDVIAGRLSPGQLLVFLAYLRGLYRPLRQISKLNQRMAKASACGDRVIEILDEVPQIKDPVDPIILRDVEGAIAFRGVDFGYEKNAPILENIDLAIAKGETLALVGPTGAGKSTLLSLIPRFFDPRAGEVCIDGIPVDKVSVRSLRRHVSFLQQDAMVLGMSIAENIAYGAHGLKRSSPGMERIERAAKAAKAHEFIVKLPDGYDTVVGERGSTLSGGQRQRIAIARAFLRKAPILLLDEPISGLDPISARQVLDAFDELRKNKTVVVIAHHLSTVLRADRIAFIKDGGVLEAGSHAELLAAGGLYAEFFETEWGAKILTTAAGSEGDITAQSDRVEGADGI